MIDSVIASRYINETHSYELIRKLSHLTSQHFVPHNKNIYVIKDFCKTENYEVFLNIEIIDQAIEEDKQILVKYLKYGIDKELHIPSTMILSPYQCILHNQRYFFDCLQ